MKARLIVLGLFWAIVIWANAQSSSEGIRGSILPQSVVVRSGPSETYLPIGSLVQGDIVRAVSRNTTNRWYLIVYRRGFGWIRGDLVDWDAPEALEQLPIILETNLTPTIAPGAETATPFLPTATPPLNYVLVNAESAFVRAGPGRTYLRLGQLFSGQGVEPFGRNADTSWVMIRFRDGFGWVATNLVRWQQDLTSLPVLSEDNLTPTLTFTPSQTSSRTPTPTSSATPSATLTFTIEPTATNTPTPTSTYTLTSTPTPTNTFTATYTHTATHTPTPTATHTLTPTATLTPTITATETATLTSTATNTDVPTIIPPSVTQAALILASATFTITPSETPSLTATQTASATDTDIPPSATFTQTPSSTAPPTATFNIPMGFVTTAINVRGGPGTEFPSIGAIAADSLWPLLATDPSGDWYKIDYQGQEGWIAAVFVEQMGPNTLIPIQTRIPTLVILSPTPEMTEAVIVATTLPSPEPQIVSTDSSERDIRLEALVGGVGLSIVALYIVFYWRGLMVVNRYRNGFVVNICPVCLRGQLSVEMKIERTLGVPTARRIIRCNECRSVLREVGIRRWRYAVDPIENPNMYAHYNNREISDDELIRLDNQPLRPPKYFEPRVQPRWIDEDESEQ